MYEEVVNLKQMESLVLSDQEISSVAFFLSVLAPKTGGCQLHFTRLSAFLPCPLQFNHDNQT